MSLINFYTQNGWEGKNFNYNLSTKDIAEKVREFCKKTYPGWKFSVRIHSFSGGSEINIDLKGGPFACPIINAENDSYTKKWGIQIHGSISEEENRVTEEVRKALSEVFSYANSFNFSDCDSQIDYFHVNFWLMGTVSGEEEWKMVEKKSVKERKSVSLDNVVSSGVKIVRYSEKCLAIVGDTKPLKTLIKEKFRGRFNPSLTIDGQKVAGWVVACSNVSLEDLEKAFS